MRPFQQIEKSSLWGIGFLPFLSVIQYQVKLN